jgi:hypothetical protein
MPLSRSDMPLWRLTDAELGAIASSDDPRADKAADELAHRGHECLYGPTPEDTPALELPWWEQR